MLYIYHIESVTVRTAKKIKFGEKSTFEPLSTAA